MAHLPMDDAQSLFQGNKEMSWSGLYKELQQRRGKAEGISDTLIVMLMPIAQHMEQSKQPYPGSPDELQKVLNNELMKVPEPSGARR